MDSEMMMTDTASKAPAMNEDETESRTLDEELKPSRRRLNKENVNAQTRTPCEPTSTKRGGGLANRPEFALQTPSKHRVTVTEPTEASFQSPTVQKGTEMPALKTPPGTSKLLRKHFAQISLTPKRPHLQAGPVRIDNPAATPKRFITTGAVRIEPTPHHVPKSTVKQPKRLGYDGTVHTPSKELLRSTACSRSHQIIRKEQVPSTTSVTPPMSPLTSTTPPPLDNDELDGSLDSSLVQSPREQVHDRQGCENPVAMTLLNDGKEDLQQLLERDVDLPTLESNDDSTVASCPSLLKVSSSLLDVMDQSDVAGLARPVPFRASRSQP